MRNLGDGGPRGRGYDKRVTAYPVVTVSAGDGRGLVFIRVYKDK